MTTRATRSDDDFLESEEGGFDRPKRGQTLSGFAVAVNRFTDRNRLLIDFPQHLRRAPVKARRQFWFKHRCKSAELNFAARKCPGQERLTELTNLNKFNRNRRVSEIGRTRPDPESCATSSTHLAED